MIFRQPEVVVIRDRSLHRNGSRVIDLTTSDEIMAEPPPFRRGHRIEGSKRPEQTPEPDNAIALALKRAKEKKDAERAAEKAERDEAKRARVQAAAARIKQRNEAPPPPIAQSEQAMRVVESMEDAILDAAGVVQPEVQPDPSWMNRPPPVVQRPQPEDSHRLPDTARRVQRPKPDDPRVKNGTLAPTPRVAERIAAMTPNTAAETAPRERPLQDKGRPDWYENVLKNGDLLQIRAGRDPATLKGDDLEAYQRVLREGPSEKIRAGRKISNLPENERQAFYAVAGRQSAATRRERYGNISPRMMKKRRAMEEGLAAGEPVPMQILPKGTKPTFMEPIKGDPLWIYRTFLAAHAKVLGPTAISNAAGFPSRWTLRDQIIKGRRHPKDFPPADILAGLSAVLDKPEPYFLDPDYPVYADGDVPPVREMQPPRKRAAPTVAPTPAPTVDLSAVAEDMTVKVHDALPFVMVDGVKYLPTYPIEDDVPLPAPSDRIIWGFAAMKVGGSFAVPIDARGAAKITKEIQKAVVEFQAGDTEGRQFQIGTLPGEVRCWRLK